MVTVSLAVKSVSEGMTVPVKHWPPEVIKLAQLVNWEHLTEHSSSTLEVSTWLAELDQLES